MVVAGGVGGTPPAISGAGVFFSGADMTVAKRRNARLLLRVRERTDGR